MLHRAFCRSAGRLIAFLEHNGGANSDGEKLKFPYSRLFPQNCCEGVSAIFSILLAEKYGLQDVAIIRGTDPGPDEHHFWVRAGGRIYDLTAQQFGGLEPVFGALEHPLAAKFSDQTERGETDAVDRDEIIALYHRDVIPF